jgi:hypothetical protein
VAEIQALIERQPLIFIVAKGDANACGPGCSEWIAAEGMIDPGAVQRLREFLGAQPCRKLPVYFLFSRMPPPVKRSRSSRRRRVRCRTRPRRRRGSRR